MSITDQLEEERREKVARAISAQGWSCEMHEPDYYCSQCQPLLLATADAAIEASGLPLRNAQVAAALAKCDEFTKDGEELMAEWHERGEESDEIELLSQGADLVEMARVIRQAIEEAGA